MTIRWAAALVATGMLVSFHGTAEACSCIAPQPPCEAFNDCSAVFVGLVSSIVMVTRTEDIGERRLQRWVREVTFSVNQVYKGDIGNQSKVWTGVGGGDCGYNFLLGVSYLVYAYGEPADLGTGICSRTRPLNGAGEDLAFLKGLKDAKPGGTVYGTVKRVDGDTYYGPQTEVGPLAGLKITVRHRDERFEALTDSNGKYHVDGLPPGAYEVSVELPDYLGAIGQHATIDEHGSYSGRKVEVSDRGCVEESITVSLDGRVSGRLLGSDGSPVRHAMIELAKFGSRDKNGADFQTFKAHTDSAGAYEFRMVQPGTYLLGINITFPPLTEMPYPRTFFPGVNDPSEAEIIVVGSGTRQRGYDLKLRPRLAVREISGVVRWSDGRPAAGADVSLDLAEYRGFLKMIPGVGAQTDSQGRFHIKALDGLTYTLEADIVRHEPRFTVYKAAPQQVVVHEGLQPITFIIPVPEKQQNR